MVVGLSLASRSVEHSPLPQADLEGGSSHSAEGVTHVDDVPGNVPPTGKLLAKAGDAFKAGLAALDDRAAMASEVRPPPATECPLREGDSGNVDAAERERVGLKLSWAIVLCCVFMGVEVAGGVLSNSLAILTDAAHLLSDVAGFSLSLFALWAASWRPTRRHSFGYHRMEVLGALGSVLLTWAITGVILVEAINRLVYSSGSVNGRLMFLTAAFGVVVNVAMAVLLSEHHSHGLPGQSCTHAHSHSHKHPASKSPSAGMGYAVLDVVEEGRPAKDAFVENGKVALSGAGSEGGGEERVAVIVHRHDDGHAHEKDGSCVAHCHCNGGGHAERREGGHSEGHSAHHCHSPSHQHHNHHPHSHHVHAQAHYQSHAHSKLRKHVEHPTKLGESELPTTMDEHADCSSTLFNPSKAEGFSPLISPLHLLSDAPEYLAHKLDEMATPDAKCGGHSPPPRSQNLNLRGAFVHVVGDLVQSVGVMVAGAVIWARPEWRVVDLGCTFLFSALVVGTTAGMVRDIARILMEATPPDVDVAALETRLAEVAGVHGVHRLHVWALSVGKNALTCHLTLHKGADGHQVLREASALCYATYGIENVTLQIEA